MGSVVAVTQTQRYYCQTPIDRETVCGYRWALDVPATGKMSYQIACPRCGHSYEVTVKAPKPPRPPKPWKPKPARVCHHPGNGYTDQRGRHRCSMCGERAVHAKLTDEQPC